MSKINFNNLDILTAYHDRTFDCDATFKVEEAKKLPFTEEFMEYLNEFCEKVGELKFITIKFNYDGD